MSAFDSVLKRVQPQVVQNRILNTTLTSAAYDSGDGVYIWNMQAGKLGSINGSTYGTYSLIGIDMARGRWSNLWVGIYAGTWWNQNTTFSVFGETGIQSVPLNVGDQRVKLLEVTITSGITNFRFGFSDALPADGGVVGSSVVALDAHYRVHPGLACPQVAIQFVAGGAPSSGIIEVIDICRTT